MPMCCYPLGAWTNCTASNALFEAVSIVLNSVLNRKNVPHKAKRNDVVAKIELLHKATTTMPISAAMQNCASEYRIHMYLML